MLTVPALEELAAFRMESYSESDNEEIDMAEAMLQRATDAVWATTGIENDPTDARLARIVKYAIMDLALWLQTQAENREEINSPFTSERIGSYSYSKAQQAKDAASNGAAPSGLYWLDLLFRLLADASAIDTPWVTSENVFNPDALSYKEFEERERESYIWDYGVPYRDPGV